MSLQKKSMKAGELPSFLGIGAQRAGTTWLYSHLKQHPEIWMPPVKELHFFDRDAKYPSPSLLKTTSPVNRFRQYKRHKQQFHDGAKKILEMLQQGKVQEAHWWWRWTFGTYNNNWYVDLYNQGKSFKAAGEITPSYAILNHQDVKKIQEINPAMKLIFMIRNPIERSWSAVRFFKRKHPHFNINSTSQIISLLQSNGFLRRSDYMRTIETYQRCFGHGHLLVCFYDAILNNPGMLMIDIAHFLGISPFINNSAKYAIKINPSPDHPMPVKVATYLHDYYSPMIGKLAKIFCGNAITWNRNPLDGQDTLNQQEPVKVTFIA